MRRDGSSASRRPRRIWSTEIGHRTPERADADLGLATSTRGKLLVTKNVYRTLSHTHTHTHMTFYQWTHKIRLKFSFSLLWSLCSFHYYTKHTQHRSRNSPSVSFMSFSCIFKITTHIHIYKIDMLIVLMCTYKIRWVTVFLHSISNMLFGEMDRLLIISTISHARFLTQIQ